MHDLPNSPGARASVEHDEVECSHCDVRCECGSLLARRVGSNVELKTGGKTVTYHVVGPVEADPLNGKISNESPIGLALMGKKIGDIATITTPKGSIDYKVVKVG